MLPSLPLKMPLPLPATVILFLIIILPSYESSRTLYGEEQNMMKKNHFLVLYPPITSGNTPPSKVNKRAITSGHFNVSPLLRRQLLKGPIAPSAPNPTIPKRSHNAMPNGAPPTP